MIGNTGGFKPAGCGTEMCRRRERKEGMLTPSPSWPVSGHYNVDNEPGAARYTGQYRARRDSEFPERNKIDLPNNMSLHLTARTPVDLTKKTTPAQSAGVPGQFLTGRHCRLSPRLMQFFVAVDQAMVPVEPFELHTRWRQAEEAHAAVHCPQYRVHPGIAKHPTEVGNIVVQFQVVIELHFQHHTQGLVKQAALDRVVVVLQESRHLLLRLLELLQGQIDQQLQLKNRKLPPVRILIKFDTDQGGDIGVLIELIVFQAIKQCRQRGIVQTMQVQNIGTEQQRLVRVIPDQILYRVDFRIIGHKNT